VTLGDFYPSGDEYELVYTATGRLIPPAGIPLQVGSVVNKRRDALQRAPGGARRAGHAEVSLGVRRGERAEIVLGAGGDPVSRPAALAGGATVDDFGVS